MKTKYSNYKMVNHTTIIHFQWNRVTYSIERHIRQKKEVGVGEGVTPRLFYSIHDKTKQLFRSEAMGKKSAVQPQLHTDRGYI